MLGALLILNDVDVNGNKSVETPPGRSMFGSVRAEKSCEPLRWNTCGCSMFIENLLSVQTQTGVI